MKGKPEDQVIGILLAAASAVLWIAFWHLNAWFFSGASFSKGISLIYFPAGVRLAIVLLFGVWGAIGIALGNPLLFLSEFGQQPAEEIILNSLIAGFVPLIAARGAQRLLGIDSNLASLRPVHLPLLALAVSVATPLAFNAQFLILGAASVEQLWRNVPAMMLGDFLGCMVALVIVRFTIWAYRLLAPRPA